MQDENTTPALAGLALPLKLPVMVLSWAVRVPVMLPVLVAAAKIVAAALLLASPFLFEGAARRYQDRWREKMRQMDEEAEYDW